MYIKTIICLFFHQLKDVYVFFQFRAIMNSAAMNIHIIPLCGYIISFLLDGNRWVIGQMHDKLHKAFLYHSPKWLYHFAVLSAMIECSSSSIFSSVFGVVSVLDFCHSEGHVVISHCCLIILNFS